MDNCFNCGVKLQENAKFCDSCGSRVMQARQEVRQQNFVPNNPVSQQNAYVYNSAYKPGYQRPAAKPKINHILFIFVTSIVFFSYLAGRLFITLVLPFAWTSTSSSIYNVAAIIYVIVGLLAFVIMLVQLILAVNCFKNRNRFLEIKSPAGMLSWLCIASFLLSLALLISAIFLFAGTGSVFSSYYIISEIKVVALLNLIFAIMFFIFDIVFLVFASINFSKARRFKEQINKLYEKEQIEEAE